MRSLLLAVALSAVTGNGCTFNENCMVTHIVNYVSYCEPVGCADICHGYVACPPPAPPSAPGGDDNVPAWGWALIGIGIFLVCLVGGWWVARWYAGEDDGDAREVITPPLVERET